MKNAALYDPYFDTLGGGEFHILSILKVLNENDHKINIFWDTDLTAKIKERFGLTFNQLEFKSDIFKSEGVVKKFSELSKFNYFFYVTDGSYFFSGARNNFVFCMVPSKSLFSLNLINKLKLFNYNFISNSPFTSLWLKKYGINSVEILPFVRDDLLNQNTNIDQKDKIILSVARFFPHLHKKNHQKIIDTFSQLKKTDNKFKDYKLILAGGLKKEDEIYFKTLESQAKKDNGIIFKPNIKTSELIKLYKKAKYFWHFAGLGVDENKHPEAVEHLGITPLEAMASGCIVFCHNSGGPKILFKDKFPSLLFDKESEIIQKIISVNSDLKFQNQIIAKSKQLIVENFTYKHFQAKVKALLNLK